MARYTGQNLLEAVLQQTDRATRYVNCGTTVATSCTPNPQEIKVMVEALWSADM